MYHIEWQNDALNALRSLTRRDARWIYDVIDTTLAYQPALESRNLKRLRPNSLAEWELRIGDFRVFYNIKDSERLVTIITFGEKRRDKLIVHGKEFTL